MKKNKSIISALLICSSVLLNGCNTVPGDDTMIPNTCETENTINIDESVPVEDSESDSDVHPPEKVIVPLPEGFIFPVTDGSTSTTNLDKAIRSAILGGEQTVAHKKHTLPSLTCLTENVI